MIQFQCHIYLLQYAKVFYGPINQLKLIYIYIYITCVRRSLMPDITLSAALGFPPACINNDTISVSFSSVAICKGVLWSYKSIKINIYIYITCVRRSLMPDITLSAALGSPPACINNDTTSMSHLSTAICKGVFWN